MKALNRILMCFFTVYALHRFPNCTHNNLKKLPALIWKTPGVTGLDVKLNVNVVLSVSLAVTVYTEVPAGVEEAFMDGFEPTMSFGLVNDVDRCTIVLTTQRTRVQRIHSRIIHKLQP